MCIKITQDKTVIFVMTSNENITALYWKKCSNHFYALQTHPVYSELPQDSI